MREIAAGELAGRLARGERLVVLDVREPGERSFCAITVPPTAADLHVPMGHVPGRLGEVRAAMEGATGVVYCHHGVRSRMVGEWLERQGLPDLRNLTGGIDAWSTAVDPAVPRY